MADYKVSFAWTNGPLAPPGEEPRWTGDGESWCVVDLKWPPTEATIRRSSQRSRGATSGPVLM